MGHVEVAHLSHALPDGRVLLDDISFRVGDGSTVALIGPNGAGKTTLMRLIAGDATAQSGSITQSGGLGVMRQFIGGIRDETTVRDLLLSIASQRVRDAAARLDAAEIAMMERDDEPAQMRYAAALAEWGDAGGYDYEVHWDACTVAAIGIPVRPLPVARGADALGRRAEAAGARVAAAQRATRSCCSTSPTTTWTCQASSGSRSSFLSRPRPCCWSATIVSCSRRARNGSSPSRTAMSGRTAAGSRRMHRPGGTGTSGSTSCDGAGTRSTRSSRNWCGRCG